MPRITHFVVTALAACKEPIEKENGTCVLCGRSVSCTGRPDDHESTCPWRMAKTVTEEPEFGPVPPGRPT